MTSQGDTISQIWSGAAIEHRFLQQVYCKGKKMEGKPTVERDLKNINQLQIMNLFPSWFKETKNIMKQLRKRNTTGYLIILRIYYF